MARGAALLVLCISLLCAHAQGKVTAADKETARLMHEGEKAYRAGDHARAIASFSEVLLHDPDDLNAYLQRGFCHSLRHEYEEAVADFTAVIERKSDHLWAYTSRGSAYNKLGRFELAMHDFDTVLGLDPRNQEAYNNRGWSRKSLGDEQGACKDWKASRRLGNEEAGIILKNTHCQ